MKKKVTKVHIPKELIRVDEYGNITRTIDSIKVDSIPQYKNRHTQIIIYL